MVDEEAEDEVTPPLERASPSDPQFHQFSLPFSAITVIDTEREFESLINSEIGHNSFFSILIPI